MKCDFGYINYRDGPRASATCWYRRNHCPKSLNINLFIMKTLMLQYFSLLFVVNRTFTHCPTRWKIFMDFLLAFVTKDVNMTKNVADYNYECSGTNASPIQQT